MRLWTQICSYFKTGSNYVRYIDCTGVETGWGSVIL